MKLHAEITRGPWDIWARYTRGGQEMTHEIGALIHYPKGWGNWVANPMPASFTAYQQATGYIGYDRELTDNVTFSSAFSYDMLDYERYSIWYLNDAYREDEYYGKAMVQWQINDHHKVAVGTEVLHGEYGLKSLDWPHLPARCAQLTPMPRWSADMYSALGEWQWTITDRWTTFIGGRIDEHSQTDTMISPRAAVAFTPTDRDTLKLMWSRSVRAQLAEEMEKQELNALGNSAPETLSTVEFRYERQHNKALNLAATVFWHYDFDLVSWSGSDSNVIGTQKDYGVELEASYHTDRTRLAVSHGYTQLYDFDLVPGEWTLITAKPYGYGEDLAQWSNHITKLTAQHKLDDQWTANGSMRVYWGFPGMRDYDRYLRATNANEPVDPNVDTRYQANCLLNLGLQYQPSDVLTFGINGYYLLGILNEDLNKRVGSKSAYRDHAPALGIWAIYKFR